MTPTVMARAVATALLILGAITPGVSRGAEEPFAECLPLESPEVVVGEVACQRIQSDAIGGVTAVAYYVPPACTAAARCPTLYLLHPGGYDYRKMLGTREAPSTWVRALTAGPPVDPSQVPDPWNYADPDGWIPLDPIEFILVAPHGRTVPGGYGLRPGMEGFWADWNPRYAAGGDAERYSTPPPRFESMMLDELIPWVESTLTALPGRAARAISGTAIGGYGSYLLGLRHPDVWSSVGAFSGAQDLIPAPAVDPLHADVTAPGLTGLGVPYQPIPVVRPAAFDEFIQGVNGEAGVTYVLGDPSSDAAYIRGNMPRHLAMNARASAGGTPSVYLRATVNDAIPRRAEDFSDPFGGIVATAVQGILLASNLSMEAAFENQGVHREFEIHPGLESDPYFDPFVRAHLAALYAHVRHHDGGGSPPPAADSFDYRSIDRTFTIWDWSFRVERDAAEFLHLFDVSCRGLTLQGTGLVTVTVPDACSSGLDGEPVFSIDLGPGSSTDDVAGAGSVPGYGARVTITLTPLT